MTILVVCDTRGYLSHHMSPPTGDFSCTHVSVTRGHLALMQPVYLAHLSQRKMKRNVCGHAISALRVSTAGTLNMVRAPSFHALQDLNCPSTRLPFTAEDPSKAPGLSWVTGQHQKTDLRTDFSLLNEVTCSSTCFPGALLPGKSVITIATSAVHLASVLDLLG